LFKINFFKKKKLIIYRGKRRFLILRKEVGIATGYSLNDIKNQKYDPLVYYL